MCATKPHFFQPLIPGFEDALSIPAAFFKHLKGQKREIAMLETQRKGKLWPVKINGRQFGDGWKQFVQDHDLQIGDFLVFRHEGDLVFNVHVFGRTGCERKYPPFTATEEEPLEIQEQNIPNDSSSEHPPFTTTGEEPIEIEGRNLPKDSCSGRSTFTTIEEEPIENSEQNLPNNSEDEHIEIQEQNLPKDSSSGAVHPPFIPTEDERVAIQENNLPKCSISGKKFGRMKKRKLEAEASHFASEHPRCVIKISPISIRKHILSVPSKFARESGLNRRNCSVILQDEDGDSWTAKQLYISLSKRYYIGSGWGAFHSCHKLKAGDSLMIELLKNGATPVFKLHKLPEESNEIPEQNLPNGSSRGHPPVASTEDVPIEIQEQNLPKGSIIGKRFGRMKKVKTRSKPEASPFVKQINCVIKISPRCIRRNMLIFPMKFVRESGLYRRTCSIILKDEVEDCWRANLLYNKFKGVSHIGAGWGVFHRAHNLKGGDSLMIELVKNGEAPSFKIYKIQDNPEFTQEPTNQNNEQASSCPVIKRSYFVAKVTPFSCKASNLHIPAKFSRLHLQNRRYGQAILIDEGGRSWPAKLWYKSLRDGVHIGDGWKEFSVANKLKPGTSFVFEFIENGESPVFKMRGFRTFTGKNQEDALPHFYVNMQLYKRDFQTRIPQSFAEKHGLADRRHSSVTITNRNGKSWQVSVTLQMKNEVFMQSGWIQFVKENGIDEEDVILLELVKGGTEPHMKCYTLKQETESNQKGIWEDCEDVEPNI